MSSKLTHEEFDEMVTKAMTEEPVTFDSRALLNKALEKAKQRKAERSVNGGAQEQPV